MQESKFERENADLQRQVATLTRQLEALRSQAGAVMKPALMTSEERVAAFSELRKTRDAMYLQEETDKLIAAGFSMDRIQWLRTRADQLQTERLRADTERRLKGLPPDVDLDYSLDNSDLDLRNEIGVDEYEKYRLATGRPNGVQISSVMPGGVAEAAGLKPGDQIIRYDGRRIYSRGQITKAEDRQARPGARLIVEVLRDGRPLQFAVPAGRLSFNSPLFLPTRSNTFELASAVLGESGLIEPGGGLKRPPRN